MPGRPAPPVGRARGRGRDLGRPRAGARRRLTGKPPFGAPADSLRCRSSASRRRRYCSQGVCLLGLAGSASAITPPSGFIDTTVVSGLSSPTSMVWDASSARLFVTEQGGDLRVVKNGALLGTRRSHLTVDSNGERGLLGVELDPNFVEQPLPLPLLHGAGLAAAQPGEPLHRAGRRRRAREASRCSST